MVGVIGNSIKIVVRIVVQGCKVRQTDGIKRISKVPIRVVRIFKVALITQLSIKQYHFNVMNERNTNIKL